MSSAQDFSPTPKNFSFAQAAVLIAAPDRSRSDMCPGALSLHQAQDGAIGRVRFPGGRIAPEQWTKIAQIANELGNSVIHLTTRGNLQFRGVQDVPAFSEAIAAADFLPSAAHDKIRNILVSPLSPELHTYATALDRALLARPDTAGLSGRTLFGFDAGDGAIAARRPDFGVVLQDSPTPHAHFVLAGKPTGLAAKADPTLLAELLSEAAAQWQQSRGEHWRTHEAPDVVAAIHAWLAAHPAVAESPVPELGTPPERPIGWIQEEGSHTVTLGAGLRFGLMTAQIAQVLGAVGTHTSITPWASLVIHDLHEGDAEAVVKVLAPLGLIFDANSPWLKVTACTGLPGCQKSLSYTQQDAIALVESGDVPAGLVHFSGCDRRCGHPLEHHTEYVATGDGEYEVATR
ncbi:precorrin-3B synthase [Corynebacterium sp. 35RC1]|nr:precorrin-3B synthase [Corynebacterium sp. 35RC1]